MKTIIIIILVLLALNLVRIIYKGLRDARKAADDNRRIYESEYQRPKKDRS